MRLLFVCQASPKLSDGSLLIAYKLAEYLSRRHEPDLVFLKSSGDTPPPSFFREVTEVPFDRILGIGSRIKNVLSPRPNLVSYYSSREMQKEIYRLNSKRRYDIIIAMTMNMAQFIVHMPDIKKVVMPHDAEHLIYRQILGDAKGILHKAKAWLWWKKVCVYQKRIYPLFDCCIVVSERDRASLEKLSPRIKVKVLPSGVDTDYFKPSREKTCRKEIIVFTGVMNTWSNVDAVIYFVRDIFPLVRKKIPSAKFLIVGKRPADTVKKMASPNIIVTGEVPDIRPYLESADILIAPFRIGTGLKHKILEAMAMGVPVVSTTLGANGILVKSGENIMLADTPEKFARAIVELFKNNNLRENITKNALEMVKSKYNWNCIGQTMEDILTHIKNGPIHCHSCI